MDYEQLGLTLPESTLSWADRHASVRPLLESVLGLLTRATAGPNISGSFAKLGPDGSWLKIALGCSQLTMDGSLETFSGVWPRRGTLCAGIVGEPGTSEHRTSGTGCSSLENWPTPTVEDNGRSGSAEMAQRWASGEQIPTCHQRLRTAILWPTPTATEATHGGPNQRDSAGRPGLTAAAMWRTPTVSEAADRKFYCNSRGEPMLSAQVKLNWATPTVNDSKNASLPPSMGRRDSLTGDLIREDVQGALNPDWVETLQGYPPSWTKLPEGWKNKGGRQEKAQPNTTGSRQE